MFLPPGYITLADAIEADQFFFSEVDQDREVEDSIYDLGVCLSGGVLDAFGWDTETNEVLPLPKTVWSQQNSRDLMERRPSFIEFKSSKGRRAIVPIIDVAKLSERYCPPDLFRSCIPTFDPEKWDWKVPAAGKETKGPRKDEGGRPAKFEWQHFWIEVALFADKDNLTDGKGDWSLMSKHMHNWVTVEWSEPPDRSLVNKKLARLKMAWEARQQPTQK